MVSGTVVGGRWSEKHELRWKKYVSLWVSGYGSAVGEWLDGGYGGLISGSRF